MMNNPATTISGFKNTFMSNMHAATVKYEGLTFRSSEAAYQAAKTLDLDARIPFTRMNGYQAKRAGKSLTLRPHWDEIKMSVMREILLIKFSDGYLAQRLIDTAPFTLIESVYWHDNFWGNCTCHRCQHITGLNCLGKLLTEIREQLINQL
ncbi:MAG: NADAR family protein [Gammaproteobacteria bacterium]|nr:NADAR family protein [Gammaproteobacteria bacterium]